MGEGKREGRETLDDFYCLLKWDSSLKLAIKVANMEQLQKSWLTFFSSYANKIKFQKTFHKNTLYAADLSFPSKSNQTINKI